MWNPGVEGIFKQTAATSAELESLISSRDDGELSFFGRIALVCFGYVKRPALDL